VALIVPRVPHILYGADYNPEQWPEATWQEDARLMREAGVNLVSLGIFAWAHLEPRPGAYTFDWLDRVMDLLYEHGVMVNLATATASPPPWLSAPSRDPARDARWSQAVAGGRQHFCPSSPVYRSPSWCAGSASGTRTIPHS
jgi:beta-galactosidase